MYCPLGFKRLIGLITWYQRRAVDLLEMTDIITAVL